jgi:RNA polymerase sigma factor (sigma-70 family)
VTATAPLEELERVYRSEATRIRAALARRIGDAALAEDLVQDAFAEAAAHWPVDGVPPNPGGWLATTARRRGIDRLRHAQTGREKLRLLAADAAATNGSGEVTEAAGEALGSAEAADDELLSLVFACCHPSLPRESQIALTLRTVCGLTTSEIAAAFLTSDATMGQRLSRARGQLRGVTVAMPDPDELGDRLAEVLAVVYLVFNEGYLASAARTPARRDLAAQAIALARTLHRLMPREPEVLGLLALLLLQESRATTRFDGWGRLVLLEDQDRSRWDRDLIADATSILDRALVMRRPGPYQLQAAIAALHAAAPSWEATEWVQIHFLYDRLATLAPSPVVLLNRAVATQHVRGASVALAEVDALATDLDGYRLFHAVRGELLAALGRTNEARAATQRALDLATNPAERELLARRLSKLSD